VVANYKDMIAAMPKDLIALKHKPGNAGDAHGLFDPNSDQLLALANGYYEAVPRRHSTMHRNLPSFRLKVYV
jgi:hypothetical protein